MKASALILAGGKSSRMNFNDKACLELNGETFLERIYKQFENNIEQIIISEGKTTKREYENDLKDAEYVKDIYEDHGPLGGLHAGLLASKEDYMCVAACDMPAMEFSLYEYLLTKDEEKYDALIPTLNGRIHPLAGIYKKRILDSVVKELEKEDNAMKHLLRSISVHYIKLDEKRKFAKMLENVNTMDEYKKLMKGDRE